MLQALEERQLLSNFTVSNTNDSGTGSLRQAIDQADAAGGTNTINFNTNPAHGTNFNTPQTISITSGNLIIQNNNLTIIGPAGALTLSGANNNGNRILTVQSGTATISQMTFSGAYSASDSGGAIYNRGILTLSYCTFSNDTASTNNVNFPSSGGGIYNNGGTLTVKFCTFSNDTTSGGYGGAFANAFGTANLTYCTFANNGGQNSLTKHPTYEGGAIYNGSINSQPTTTLTNCTVAYNTASYRGGGIFNYSGTLKLQSTIVAGNSAPQGNDIYAGSDGSVTLTSLGNNVIGDSSYSDNSNWVRSGSTADKLHQNPLLAPFNSYGGPTQTMALLPGSPAIGFGAPVPGILNDQRGFTLIGTPLDAGAFQTPNGWKNGYNLEVDSTADGAGVAPGKLDLRGAVDLASVMTGFTTEEITFDPIVFAYQQTILLNLGQLVLNVPPGQNSQTITITPPLAGLTISAAPYSRILQVNSGITANISGITITGGVSDRGAGILVNGGTLNLTSSTLTGNRTMQVGTSTGKSGGALANLGVANLVDCTVSGNSAAVDGGGLINYGTMTLTNCTVANNNAPSGGGGLFSSGSTTLQNTIVANNTDAPNSPIGPSDIGGVVQSSSSYNMIGDGGAGGLTNGPNGNIVAPPFLGLAANLGYYGGPTQTIALLPKSPALNHVPANTAGTRATDQRGFSRTTTATTDIGAFQTPNGWATPVTFSVNATSDPYALPAGYSLREAVNLANVVNRAATIDFDPVVFAQAKMIQLTVGKLEVSDQGGLDIESTAGVTVQGGGTSVMFQIDPNAQATISGLTITGGGGVAKGAGVFNSAGGNLALKNSTITGNTATGVGGGLANYGTAYLTNVTISGNSAPTGSGGGLFDGSTGTLTLTDCTVSGNKAFQGGGLWNSGTTTLIGTIVAANNASIPKTQFSDIGGIPVAGWYNLVGLDAGGLVVGTNNQTVAGNPGLMALGNYGGPTPTMALLPSSPAIGKGTVENGVATDQRGQIRGAVVDIGAYQHSLQVESTDGSVNTNPAELTLPGAVFLADAFGGPSGVTFDPAVFPGGQTIILTSTLEVTRTVPYFSITGPYAGVILTGGGSHIFQVDKGVTAYFNNLIIAGSTNGQRASLEDYGTANVERALFAGPSLTSGAAIEVSGGTLSLKQVAIENWQTGVHIVNNSTATITNAEIDDNQAGVLVGAGLSDNNQVSVTLTDLSFNTVAVQNGSNKPVGATLDWWGSSFGPNTDTGSDTKGNVVFSPWLGNTASLTLPTPTSLGFSSGPNSHYTYTVTANPTAQALQITSNSPDGKTWYVTPTGTVLFYGSGNVIINGESGAGYTTNAFTLITSPPSTSPLVTGRVQYTANDAFNGAQILFGGVNISPTVNGKGSKSNTFDVSDWTGGGTLTAFPLTALDTVVATKTGNTTLTNTSLTSADGMNLKLAGMSNANLTVNPASGSTVILDASAFTGVTNLTVGGAGNAILFGGGSTGKTSTLTVSDNATGNEILIGGPGINNLTDNNTTPNPDKPPSYNILIGGGGAGGYNTINGNDAGNDILISSTTVYDSNTPANIAALDAILAEWSKGGDAQSRAKLIVKGIPVPPSPSVPEGTTAELNQTTVTWNGKKNMLNEGGKANQRNWFIIRIPGDNPTYNSGGGSDEITLLP
jgi:hypothetical protein